jgi:pantothenate kinase-related protein Tda10
MASPVAAQRPEPEPLLNSSLRDNDEPVSTSAEDRLDFVERYAVPLARRIASKESDAPLTIGIYGSWGSGKTSLMNLVGVLVTGQDQVTGFTPESSCFVVRLNAWKYSGEQTL